MFHNKYEHDIKVQKVDSNELTIQICERTDIQGLAWSHMIALRNNVTFFFTMSEFLAITIGLGEVRD